jgi:hypothetical protein
LQDFAVKLWLNGGAPKHKLIMGLANHINNIDYFTNMLRLSQRQSIMVAHLLSCFTYNYYLKSQTGHNSPLYNSGPPNPEFNTVSFT